MCDYCDGAKPGHVCKTQYDGSDCADIAWFDGDELPTLNVKSDGTWAGIHVSNCPWCGRDLGGDA